MVQVPQQFFPASFENLFYSFGAGIGSTLDLDSNVYWRQILTSKVAPRNERVNDLLNRIPFISKHTLT